MVQEKSEQQTTPEVVTPVVTPEVKTVTPEERVKQLEAEFATTQQKMKEYQAIAEEKDKGFKSLQQRLAEEQSKSRQQSDLMSRLDNLDKKFTVLASGMGTEDEDFRSTKAKDLSAKLVEIDVQQKSEAWQRQIQETALAFQKRVEALGLTENDETYLEIQELVTDNPTPIKVKRAEVKLSRLEKESQTKKETPVKEAEVDKLAEEKSRQTLENKGYLKTDKGMPTGMSATDRQIVKDYADNPSNQKFKAAYADLMRKKK